MKKHLIFFFLIFLIISLIFPVVNINTKAQLPNNKNITFQPNIIPNVTIIDKPIDKPESFRFNWLENKLDIELFFNATYKNKTKLFSLRDFEIDFNVTVSYVVNRTENLIRFGYIIENVENISDYVHNAFFKIEDTQPFDYEEIKIEITETLEDYNITRFRLPDNLVLSFEDLRHKGFVIGHQNKTFINFSGFKNKTKWDFDPITYSAPIITVIGGTQGTPLNYWDIWNASNSNGWNVVWNNNDTQFSFNCSLQFGNATVQGTTFFNDTRKQITFCDNLAPARYFKFMVGSSYAYITFGELFDASTKSSKNGIDFINLDSNYWVYFFFTYTGNNYFYSCSFTSVGRGIVQIVGGHFYNSIFKENSDILARSNMDYFNIIMQSGGGAISYPSGIWNTITITDYVYAFFVRYAGSISNIYARNLTYLAYMSNFNFGSKYLINVNSDTWNLFWSGSNSEELFRQYEYDLTVTYPNGTAINGSLTGARVEIQHYGNNSAIDYNATLNENGTINTTVLSMGFYNQTGGNNIYGYNPFNLRIYNITGFIEYNANFTLNKKEDLIISLTSYSVIDLTLPIALLISFGVICILLIIAKIKR